MAHMISDYSSFPFSTLRISFGVQFKSVHNVTIVLTVTFFVFPQGIQSSCRELVVIYELVLCYPFSLHCFPKWTVIEYFSSSFISVYRDIFQLNIAEDSAIVSIKRHGGAKWTFRC